MKPGIHLDIPEATYHADEALSQSGAKLLLDCPARYLADRRKQRRKPTPEMEFGTVVHAIILGQPEPWVEVEADSWRTKAAQEQAKDARSAGRIPILTADLIRANAVAVAARKHPYIAAVLAAEGDNELSLSWHDERTGVACRGRLDRLAIDDAGNPVIFDIKTTSRTAAPAAFGRQAASLDYPIQAWAYNDGYRTLTGVTPTFIFAVVETEEPYLVSLNYADEHTLAVGRAGWERALDIYVECTASGQWPAYSDTPQPLQLPAWA